MSDQEDNEPKESFGGKVKGFVKRYWPYMLAGAAVVGGGSYLVYRSRQPKIDFQFTQEDISQLTRSLWREHPDEKRIFSMAKKRLREMGIKEASVDLIKSGAYVKRGSGRIPLLVKKSDGDQFVLKSYDNYNPQREKEMLTELGGSLAPRVRYLGEDFYAEDYNDPSRTKTLESMADSGRSGLDKAVKKGGMIHALLALCGKDYRHRHWFDEFAMVKGKTTVTDLGTTIHFQRYGDSEDFDERVDYIRQHGVEAYIDDKKPIGSIFSRNFSAQYGYDYEKIRNKLASLTDDPVEVVNILSQIEYAIRGIREYAERHRARVKAGIATDYQMPSLDRGTGADTEMAFLSDFVDAYSRMYKRGLREGYRK